MINPKVLLKNIFKVSNMALIASLMILSLGMGFSTTSIHVFMYYIFVSLLLYICILIKKPFLKHIMVAISISLIFLSPLLFKMDMEHFEEVFLILPIVFILIYPKTYYAIFLNIILISMYFVYPGEEPLVNIIEDSFELLLIGTFTIIISYQFYKLRSKIQQLDYESHHDLVCNIKNKNALIQILTTLSQDSNNEYTLLLFEIKDYRIIRDVFGYEHSNKLLIEFSYNIISNLSENEDVFRVGPEEFAILHIKNESSKLDVTIDYLKNFYKDKISLYGNHHSISLNIGMASSPLNSVEPIILFSLASYALRVSKAKKNNHIEEYKIEFSQNVEKKVDLINEIQLGISRKEFVPYYQPKVNVKNNTIVGVEALVRWIHPDIGIRMPDEFITICETTGMINEMGHQILEQAMIDFKTIESLVDKDFIISVNLSIVQLGQVDFVENIKKLLEQYQVKAQNIELEITESVLIENIESNLKQLHELRSLGIHIAMDDFGVKYSSFSYLKSLPLDTIKLDRIFVKDLIINSTDHIILESMTQLGHQLNLKVLAEGVETNEQLRIVELSGCDEYQGYLFSRAIPLKKLIHNYLDKKTTI